MGNFEMPGANNRPYTHLACFASFFPGNESLFFKFFKYIVIILSSLVHIGVDVFCLTSLSTVFIHIRFVTHISISLMIFMLNYAFIQILFSLRILLLAVEMSDSQAFRSQVRRIAAMDPII